MTTRNKLSRILVGRFLLEMHETDKGVILYVHSDWEHKVLSATRISFAFPVSKTGYASFVEARKAGMIQLTALVQAAQKFPISEGYDGECLEYNFETNSFTSKYHYEDSPRLSSDYRLQIEMPVADLLQKYMDELLSVELTVNHFQVGYQLNAKGGVVVVQAPWKAVDVRNKLIFSHPARAYDEDLERVLMALIAKFVILAAASAKFNMNFANDNCRLAYYDAGNYFKATIGNTVVDPTKICREEMAALAEGFQGRLRTS